MDTITYSVSTENLKYTSMVPQWNKIEDCIAGEDTIKSKREIYLPRPSGMDSSKEGEAAYTSYIFRAHYPDFVNKFLSALTGITKINPPRFILPPQLEYLKENCDGFGTSLETYFFQSVRESLKSGRQLIFPDVDSKSNRLKMIRYNAIDNINWGVVNRPFNNKSADYFVLKESYHDSTDIFVHEYKDQYRILTTTNILSTNKINKNKNYFTSILFDESNMIIDGQEVIPNLFGKKFEGLPVTVIGSTDLNIDPDTIPLFGVSTCALQMYMKDADLSNAMFLTCNPTLVISGAPQRIEGKEQKTLLGSNISINLPDPNARATYTKTDSSGLAEVRLAIRMYLEEAQSMGSALLSDNQKGVESEGALRVKAASSTASLSTVAQTCARGFETVIKNMAKWMGISSKNISINVDSNYLDNVFTNDDITSLVKLFINDVITHETTLKKLKEGGYLEEDLNENEEILLIEKRKKEAMEEFVSGELSKDAAKESILNNHIKQTDRSQDDTITSSKVNY